MKRSITFFIAAFLSCITLQAQDLRKVENTAFQEGEKLVYRIHYGLINAGEATMEVKKGNYSVNGRPVHKLVGTGRTLGAFNWFFKVTDIYHSYLDEEALVPWVSLRDVNEGGYTINRKLVFDHFQNTVKVENRENGEIKNYDSLPENIQDILTSYYFARCQDYSNIQVGDIVQVNSFFDNEVFPIQVKFVGRETIKTKMGNIRCLKFKPMLQTGRVFEEEEDMTIWFSEDANHIPVRIQADILVGSIKADLKEYSGLKSPLALEE